MNKECKKCTLRRFIIFAIAVTTSFASYSQDTEYQDSEYQDTEYSVIATVNGEPVFRESVELVSSMINSEKELSSEEIVEQLINLKLLSQAARQLELDKSERLSLAVELQTEQTLANAYTAHVTNSMEVSDSDLREAYDQHVSEMGMQEFRTSHIQFESLEAANDAVIKISEGADFEELARTLSQSPDGKIAGGDIGWNAYGVESFERSADVEKLDINEISEPLETSHGWHLFKLTQTRGAVVPSYDTIKTELKAIMLRSKLQEDLDSMRAQADVEFSVE